MNFHPFPCSSVTKKGSLKKHKFLDLTLVQKVVLSSPRSDLLLFTFRLTCWHSAILPGSGISWQLKPDLNPIANCPECQTTRVNLPANCLCLIIRFLFICLFARSFVCLRSRTGRNWPDSCDGDRAPISGVQCSPFLYPVDSAGGADLRPLSASARWRQPTFFRRRLFYWLFPFAVYMLWGWNSEKTRIIYYP